MAERRKSARFALALPQDAHVSVLQQVRVEQAGSNDISVLAATPGVRGEDLTVRIGPSDAVQMTFVARTVSTEPRVIDGRVMHRIQLTMTGAIALSSGTGAAANSWRASDVTSAVFLRKYSARIVNVGRGGCLIEGASGLPVGTVATLHTGDRFMQADPVRVDFVQERRGLSWPYLTGMEFLSLEAPSSHSLRSMAARIELEGQGASLAAFGEESGSGLTNSVPGPLDILSIVCAKADKSGTLYALMETSQSQPKPGRPLALVGGTMTTSSVNETLGIDD